MKHGSQKKNRLSYENCFVYEQDGDAVGVIVAYHGSEATMLDAPIVHHLRELHKDESITLEKKPSLMNITLILYPFQVYMAEKELVLN